jgi:VWFA-related protein
MRPTCVPALLLIGLTLHVTSQQPAVKTIATGVMVDVTVVDGKGNPVVDLSPDDFELSEDGVRQRILASSLVHGGVISSLSAGAATVAQPGRQPTASIAPADVSRAAITPSVTAILFDRLSPESRALARRAALAYVSTLAPPHDYAGVFLADLSLRTFQPFTNQRENLARAVDLLSATAPANTSLAAEPQSKRLSGLDPNLSPTAGAESAAGGFAGITDREHRLNEMRADPVEWMMAQMEMRMRENYQRFLAELEGQTSIAGLRAVVSSFGALPGRKSILYFTENLPISDRQKPKFDALIGEANRANIVVYPVDAVGLRVHSKEAELGRNVGVAGAKGIGDEEREKGAWTKELDKQEEMLNSRPTAVLGRLAKDTGGFLVENTNDLGAGVARMQRERTTYYLLAYQPTNTKLDGTFRKISVKVKRSKMTVRARPGYVAPTSNETGK